MTRPSPSRPTVPVAAVTLLAIALVAPGCASEQELARELEDRARALARAVVQRQAGGLPGFFTPEAAPPGLDELTRGPLIFRRLEVVAVVPPARGSDGTWRVEYEAEVSDYPSSLLNFFVRPELLESGHQLKPYEGLVELSGELAWKRTGGTWKVARTPPDHQPLGRACALARALLRWRATRSEELRGVAAFGGTLELLDATHEPNHVGASSRGDVLLELARKLGEAAATGGATLLQPSFLPAVNESASGALEALAVLEHVLSAWWRGGIEQEADLLSAVQSGRMATAELAASPVALRSFAVTGLRADTPDRVAITVRLAVSAPERVFTVVLAGDEMDDPAGYLRAGDGALEVEEVFFLSRSGKRWMLECDPDHGVLGYLARTGRFLHDGPDFGPLTVDEDLLKAQLAFRLLALYVHFTDLDFPPLAERLDGDRREPFLRAVVDGTLERCCDGLGLQRVPVPQRCFLLGVRFAELVGGIMVQSSLEEADIDLDSAELRRGMVEARESIVTLARSLLPQTDAGELGNDLARAEVTGEGAGLGRLAAELSLRIRQHRGRECERTFSLGHHAMHLRLMTLFPQDDSDLHAQARDLQLAHLDELERLVLSLPGVKPLARSTIAGFAVRLHGSGLVTFEEAEPLTDYAWFFPTEDREP